MQVINMSDNKRWKTEANIICDVNSKHSYTVYEFKKVWRFYRQTFPSTIWGSLEGAEISKKCFLMS